MLIDITAEGWHFIHFCTARSASLSWVRAPIWSILPSFGVFLQLLPHFPWDNCEVLPFRDSNCRQNHNRRCLPALESESSHQGSSWRCPLTWQPQSNSMTCFNATPSISWSLVSPQRCFSEAPWFFWLEHWLPSVSFPLSSSLYAPVCFNLCLHFWFHVCLLIFLDYAPHLNIFLLEAPQSFHFWQAQEPDSWFIVEDRGSYSRFHH